jgi:tetratricopeptide (TPR) repeat protein
MIWKIIIVIGAALASYFIPTPKELQKAFSSGQNFFASSNYEKAIKQYDIIINTNSAFLNEDSVRVELLSGEYNVSVIVAAYYQKANALKNLKRRDEAVNIFRIVERRKDEPKLAALAQFQIYDLYYRAAQYDTAIIEARKLADKYSWSKKAEIALYDIGWAYRELNDVEASNKAFTELIEKYPETEYLVSTIYQLGQNNFDQKHFDHAIKYWTDLNERFKPESFKQQEWEKVQLKAVKERQIFEATAGRETNESILELVAKSQVKIGDAYRELNNYYKSIESYQKAVTQYTLLPSLIEVSYIKMADYTLREKGIDSARNVYQKAIDENFDKKELQAKMQYKIAETYQNEKMYLRAADEFGFYAAGYSEVADAINFSIESAYYSRIGNLYNGEAFNKTVAEVDTFLIQYPGSDYKYDLLYLSGSSNFILKNYDKSQKNFQTIIRDKEGTPQATSSKIFIGRILFEQKKYDESVQQLVKVLNEDNNPNYNDEANYYLAQVYYDSKQYQLIPPVFKNISLKSNYFIPAIIKTSKSFVLQKNLDDGEKFAKGIVSLADSMKDSVYFLPEAHYSLGDIYINKNQNEDATKELTFVVEDKKSNEMLRLQSLYLRGTLYGQINNHVQAIKDIEAALNDPKFIEKLTSLIPTARGRLATEYVKSGQLQKGVNMMLDYITASSDSLDKARYLLALSEVYYDTKDFKKAITYASKALDMSGSEEQIYIRSVYLLATSYNFTNESKEGIEVLNKAAIKFPASSEELFFNYSVNIYDNGYYKEAISAFSKFIENYPNVPTKKNSMFFIAYAYYKMGEWENSINAFREFIKAYPDDDLASEAQFNIAEAHYNLSKFSDATKEYQVVYTKHVKSDFAPAALYNEAWCFYQLKEVDDMIVPLQKLIDSYPSHNLVPEAQFTIGDYYYNKKDYSKALVEYKTFIDRFPEHYKTEEAKSFIKELSQIDAFREYQKAIVFFDKKDYKKAIAELGNVVNNYPTTEIAMACEANIASSYEQLGDKNKAIELYKKIIEKYKNNSSAAGVVYFSEQHLEWLSENDVSSK